MVKRALDVSGLHSVSTCLCFMSIVGELWLCSKSSFLGPQVNGEASI